MPRLDSATAALFMNRVGAEMLIGHGQVAQIFDAARSDTHAADGERHVYRSGATVVEQVFDAQAGAWRSTTLS